MDGVEVHAHRLAALLDLQAGGRFQMVPWPAWAGYSLLGAVLLIGVVIGERPKSLITSALVLVVAEAGLLLGSGAIASWAMGWDQPADGRLGPDDDDELDSPGDSQSGATPPV